MKKLAITCFMIPIFLKAFSQHYDNFKVSDLDSGQQFVRELGKPGMSYIEKTKKKRTFSIFPSNRILSRYFRWNEDRSFN